MPAETEIWTFHDFTEHILDVFNLQLNKRYDRQARRAAIKVMRDLPHKHRWAYFRRRGQINTVANQEAGTVQFDFTGGTFERQLTLTGATWPSDVRFYKINISSVESAIEDRKSSTVVTLDASRNPGEDLASGTTYNLYRSIYPLPIGFVSSGPIVEVRNSYFPAYVTPEVLLDNLVGNWQPQRPYMYTFRNAAEFFGAMSIEFGPPPVAARTYDFIYSASPAVIRTELENRGTVTVTAGLTALVGKNTFFNANHVGSIIRFGDANNFPSGLAGGLDQYNPYSHQRVIMAVTDSTSADIDQSMPDTQTAVKFTISDPLDVEPGAMLTYLFRAGEAEFARIMNFELAERRERDGETREALIEALNADNRNANMGHGRNREQVLFDLEDWAVSESFGGSVV